VTDVVASSAALVLASVLGVAAVAKARRPQRTAATFARLGLPRPGALAWGVPGAEAAVAVALLTTPAWGGVVAFALLAGFTAYLAALVRSGRPVSCGCFGSSGDHPVSGVDLARNAALLALAAGASTADGPLRLDPPTIAVAVALLALGSVAFRQLSRAR
jgi:hypothetical protein